MSEAEFTAEDAACAAWMYLHEAIGEVVALTDAVDQFPTERRRTDSLQFLDLVGQLREAERELIKAAVEFRRGGEGAFA